MKALLDWFFESRMVAAIGAPLIIIFLLVMGWRDWGTFRRKDPIKLWPSGITVYPGDLWYPFARWQRIGPYLGCLGIMIFVPLLAGIILVANWLSR